MVNNSSDKNKVAIITGATGNLGKAVTEKFLNENFSVVGTATKQDGEKLSNNYEEVIVDLTDEAAAEKFVDEVVNKHQQIDVAILTAGGFAMGKIAESKLSDIKKQFKINFDTAYNAAQPIFKQMLLQNRGRIFLIGSRPGLDARSSKGMIGYGLSKSLIFRLAEMMNDEAKGKNVVTSVIVPSTIDTPQNRTAMPDANFENWVKPEAIASAVYWYCTDEAAVSREPVIKVYNQA